MSGGCRHILQVTIMAWSVLLCRVEPLHASDEAGSGPASACVVDLRCEYLKEPLGVDVLKPRLSWMVETRARGWRQSAYQILVASNREMLGRDRGDLWDSGRVVSDQSLHIPHAGEPLAARMECFWKVRVWGPDDRASPWSEPASWTMGLLKEADWQAKWIGAPAAMSNAGPFTVTKATYRTLTGDVAVDVTEIVKKNLAGNKTFQVVPKNLGGDPAANVPKELVVEYLRDGKPFTARAEEFAMLGLSAGQDGEPAPLFRREFDLASVPDSARVTVHTPAYFDLYVNGNKVGKDVLSPAVFNATA